MMNPDTVSLRQMVLDCQSRVCSQGCFPFLRVFCLPNSNLRSIGSGQTPGWLHQPSSSLSASSSFLLIVAVDVDPPPLSLACGFSPGFFLFLPLSVRPPVGILRVSLAVIIATSSLPQHPRPPSLSLGPASSILLPPSAWVLSDPHRCFPRVCLLHHPYFLLLLPLLLLPLLLLFLPFTFGRAHPDASLALPYRSRSLPSSCLLQFPIGPLAIVSAVIVRHPLPHNPASTRG